MHLGLPEDPIRYLRDNWRPLTALALLVIVVLAEILSTLEEQTIALLAAAVLSLVLMVWNLEPGNESPEIFSAGLREAEPSIRDAIHAAAGRIRRRRKTVRIIGCRLRDIRSVMQRLSHDLPENIDFEFYHIAPDYLERERPWPAAVSDAPVVRSSLEELNGLLGNRARFTPYSRHPVAYAFIIENQAIFWGYFILDEDGRTYVGPSNPCLAVRRTDAGFDETLEWLDGLCQEWDRAATGL